VIGPREVLAALEQAGTPKNRKAYAAHGVTRLTYGVSFASLRAIARKIGADTVLAQTLWASGNHDARMLATLLADPAAVDATLLDRWLADCDSYLITTSVSDLAARTSGAAKLAERWTRDLGEWRSAAGWNIVGALALRGGGPDDDWFRAFLPEIGETIHQRPNHTRHAMNAALVAIGSRSATLQRQALRIAGLVGTVTVDHGETGLTTPDAREAIPALAAKRKEGKADVGGFDGRSEPAGIEVGPKMSVVLASLVAKPAPKPPPPKPAALAPGKPPPVAAPKGAVAKPVAKATAKEVVKKAAPAPPPPARPKAAAAKAAAVGKPGAKPATKPAAKTAPAPAKKGAVKAGTKAAAASGQKAAAPAAKKGAASKPAKKAPKQAPKAAPQKPAKKAAKKATKKTAGKKPAKKAEARKPAKKAAPKKAAARPRKHR